MISTSTQDEKDNFENAFFYYVSALKVLASEAAIQCEEMDNYNAPHEIQLDVGEAGLYLPRSPACYLELDQIEKIVELTAKLKALPDGAINPLYMTTTSRAGCLTAMNHPLWEPLRKDAAQLLKLLDPAIQKNEAYFQS